jgi:predicted transcriptional regulator
MAERTIFQTGIGLDAETLARCDRLRACLGRSRSHVIEQALRAGGLDALEAQASEEIETFHGLASQAGLTWQQYAAAYVEAFGAKTYPPDVATLAAMQFTGRETRAQLERKMTRLAGQRRAARRAADAVVESMGEVGMRDEDVPHPLPARPMSLRDLRP